MSDKQKSPYQLIHEADKRAEKKYPKADDPCATAKCQCSYCAESNEVDPECDLVFTADQADNLKSLTRVEFDNLKAAGVSNSKIGPTLSVAQDLKTGRISPVFRNDPSGNIPDNLNDFLARRFAEAPDDVLAFERTKGMGSHSEIFAVNDLLNARHDAKLSDFAVFTQEVKMASLRGSFKPACIQCNFLLDGVQYVK